MRSPGLRTAAVAYFAGLRRREFARLDESDQAYLDYTGAGLYPRSLVARHAEWLGCALMGNPHSEHAPSRRSTSLIEEAKARVLRFFHADPAEYAVVFTANASAAFKLVGESYPFGPQSRLLLTADNHNSVNGLRRFAVAAGASVVYAGLDGHLSAVGVKAMLARAGRLGHAPRLFAFPAQSNFSGVRHPLGWIDHAHHHGWDVLLDAAAFAPTNPLNLAAAPADFVGLSFYKMFGYPTGIGALVARRDRLARLRRPWFAGGTVAYVSVEHDLVQYKAGGDAYEDGTADFLNVPAVVHGLDFLDLVGLDRLGAHVRSLRRRCVSSLRALRHPNGTPVVTVYGPAQPGRCGGVVTFNLCDARGAPIPFDVVEAVAARTGVAVRGGCFCNPGASEFAFGLRGSRTKRCFERLGAEFTPRRFAECLPGGHVGALRASFGVASAAKDVDRLVGVVHGFIDAGNPTIRRADRLANEAVSPQVASP
ncbi:MAG TPA: aminotransferase class V-fold PLP-dependent enzyme [Gemmatimonadales bacterium]